MGRKWTQDDVLAYNIKVVYEDLETFFGITDLPPPNVESDALTAQDVTAAKNHDHWTCAMLFLMNHVADPDNVESGTINFVTQLLNVARYPDVYQNRYLMLRPKLQYMPSQGRPPQVDVCIRDESTAILLVVKSGQALARVRSGAPTYFRCHCCLP
jgi:hypothetical protein